MGFRLNTHSHLFLLGLLPLKILFYLGFRLRHLKGIAQKEGIALSAASCDKAYPSKVERRTSYRTNLIVRLTTRPAISPIHAGTLESPSGPEPELEPERMEKRHLNSGFPHPSRLVLQSQNQQRQVLNDSILASMFLAPISPLSLLYLSHLVGPSLHGEDHLRERSVHAKRKLQQRQKVELNLESRYSQQPTIISLKLLCSRLSRRIRICTTRCYDTNL